MPDFDSPLLRLYPQPAEEAPLRGLYLAHDLRRQLAERPDRPYVYTNYVMSLDGRIAVAQPGRADLVLPKTIANERDWRLFQELAVQADVILTSGRYLRQYAEGRGQEILQVYNDPRFADLRDWRLARGLPPYPAFAVVSASLQFPIPPALVQEGRPVIVATTEEADPARVEALRAQLGTVVIAGRRRVEGRPLVEQLVRLGYRLIYNATGPQVMHLLLADDMLDRVYLTVVSRLVGGDPFAPLVQGPLLSPAVGLRLHSLYWDAYALEGDGQLFLCYDRER